MAVVRDYYTPGGAHVIIHDDAYAHISVAEARRREACKYKVAANILMAEARRQREAREKRETSRPSKINPPGSSGVGRIEQENKKN